jgi:AraC family transcriptional regulator
MSDACRPRSGAGWYAPIVARTQSVLRPSGSVIYDCVKVIVVRDGSAIVFSEFGRQRVKVGDVLLLGANVLCGGEPERRITVTTTTLDTDYLVDQLFWQYCSILRDRLEALGSPRPSTRNPCRHPGTTRCNRAQRCGEDPIRGFIGSSQLRV